MAHTPPPHIKAPYLIWDPEQLLLEFKPTQEEYDKLTLQLSMLRTKLRTSQDRHSILCKIDVIHDTIDYLEQISLAHEREERRLIARCNSYNMFMKPFDY
jgi:hypothetical protein